MNHPIAVTAHRMRWLVAALLFVPVAHAAPSSQIGDVQRCAQLAARIEAIDARMRLAYTGAAGERMREQRRRLQQQMWELRCRR